MNYGPLINLAQDFFSYSLTDYVVDITDESCLTCNFFCTTTTTPPSEQVFITTSS